ncbi:MAG: aminotransferase class I/II-fold pyridoxal phosphate-dependent enzyme [Candidatus Lokiarchaeota archaeon]|nr:aminotransferase class I/II-fold pyridoxal phosphate-dependent enzyme [Candidatus Lokiarchaeota archaeon]
MGSKLSDRVKSISYPITEIVAEAKKLEESGKKIIYLNIGDPPHYGFEPNKLVFKELYNAVNEGYNDYTHPSGLSELKDAIVKYEKKENNVVLPEENIFTALGSSEGLQYAIASLIDPGDEALIPSLWYPLYPNYMHLYNGKIVPYNLIEDQEWKPDLDDIRTKISDKTRFILLNNPNNPTGAVYSKKTVEKILDIAAEYDLIVISDEVYSKIIYEGDFHSTSSLTKDTCVITSNGVSKAYALTGWRLGWLHIIDPKNTYIEGLKSHLDKLTRTRLSANVPMQKACAAILNNSDEIIDKNNKELSKRCNYVYKRLKETPGIDVVKPKGTLFIFPRINESGNIKNDKDFVRLLLREKGVCMVHGTSFGKHGLNHFREVFLESLDALEKAHDSLDEFMKHHLNIS